MAEIKKHPDNLRDHPSALQMAFARTTSPNGEFHSFPLSLISIRSMQFPGWIEGGDPGEAALVGELLAEVDAIRVIELPFAATPSTPSIEGNSDSKWLANPKPLASKTPRIDYVFGAQSKAIVMSHKGFYSMGPLNKRFLVS